MPRSRAVGGGDDLVAGGEVFVAGEGLADLAFGVGAGFAEGDQGSV
jgi:hypothetical protein